jgi:hypothetical protein
MYTKRPQGWLVDLAHRDAARSASSARMASASSTTIYMSSNEPGSICLRPLPRAIEHADPGGVSCTNRSSQEVKLKPRDTPIHRS